MGWLDPDHQDSLHPQLPCSELAPNTADVAASKVKRWVAHLPPRRAAGERAVTQSHGQDTTVADSRRRPPGCRLRRTSGVLRLAITAEPRGVTGTRQCRGALLQIPHRDRPAARCAGAAVQAADPPAAGAHLMWPRRRSRPKGWARSSAARGRGGVRSSLTEPKRSRPRAQYLVAAARFGTLVALGYLSLAAYYRAGGLENAFTWDVVWRVLQASLGTRRQSS